MDYPCLPNICNLDAHLQRTGRGALWPDGGQLSTEPSLCRSPETKKKSRAKTKITPDDDAELSHKPPEPKKSRTSGSNLETALTLTKESPLYRLRWVTLGYHYDWTKKEYNSENTSPFPEDLATLSSVILRCVGFPGLVQLFERRSAYRSNHNYVDSATSAVIRWTLHVSTVRCSAVVFLLPSTTLFRTCSEEERKKPKQQILLHSNSAMTTL
jgi:hypothetical protein